VYLIDVFKLNLRNPIVLDHSLHEHIAGNSDRFTVLRLQNNEEQAYVAYPSFYLKVFVNDGDLVIQLYRMTEKDDEARSDIGQYGPLRKQCHTHSVDKALYDAMHQRLQTPRGKAIMKRRGSTVEPVLGTLVNCMGMNRYRIATSSEFGKGPFH